MTDNDHPSSSMTAEEFEKALPRLSNLSGNVVAAARYVLVDGHGPSRAGELVGGMSRQSVNNAVKRVRAILDGFPADWVRVNELMPPELAAEVRQRIRVAVEELNK